MKEHRGFGSPTFDREVQKEIAAAGGRAAHQGGKAHEWTSEEAKMAGRKGGMISGERRKAKRIQMEQARRLEASLKERV